VPKRSSGGTKAPVRGLTGLFRELDPQTKTLFDSAFADAENLIDFHSRSVPERQRRRRISGLVKTIVLRAESNLLGGFLSWDRLDDQRISFYEAQVSNDNIFSDPETITTLDTFIALENLRSIKYARVRGVRGNKGEAGLWSNTVTITPRVSAPTVYSLDFYQRYSGAEPFLLKKLRYSGGLSHLDWEHPQFYTVLDGEFYADRLVGGLLAWGAIMSRFKKYAEGGRTAWDRVRFRVGGITRMDGYFPLSVNYPDITNFNKNDFHDTTGALMTFYMQEGYTASFGPYAVNLPNTLAGYGPNDPRSIVTLDTPDGAFYWEDVNNAQRASRWDEAQCSRYNDTLPHHEAHSDSLTEGGTTDWIIFRDYRMNVPTNAVVAGIQVDLKRRQPNNFSDEIGANFGVTRPDRALGHDLCQEYRLTGSSPQLTQGSILNDVDFGRYIDLTAGITGTGAFAAGRLLHDITGIPDNSLASLLPANETRLWTGNKVTFSAWFRLPTPLSIYGAGSRDSYVFAPESFSSVPFRGARMFVTHDATTNAITSYTFRWEHGSFLNYNLTATGNLRNVNRWHLFTVTYDQTNGTNGDLKVYIDGIERAGTLTSSSFNKNLFVGNARWQLSLGGFTSIGKISIMSMAHYAIWDKVLAAKEILELYNASGRVDFRHDFGDYRSAGQLCHYFFSFPDQADIRDFDVRLVDDTGAIRTDLDQKAITTETWPQLGRFFYHEFRQYGFLPLGISDQGIPHDNHAAIGYQKYGGELDTWGGSWTPTQVNGFYFGFALRAKNEISLGFRGNAFIDHAKMTVYTVPRLDRTVQLSVEVAVSNQFYQEREIFGGLMNLIELGEKLAGPA